MSDRLRAELAAAGERLRVAESKRSHAMDAFVAVARKAEGKVPIRQIALAGGLSRTTVYKMLEEK